MSRARAAGLVLGALLAVAPAGALQIDVVYDDLPGEGFLDPVLGAPRQAAFAAAVDQWSRTLGGTAPIVIAANMLRLGGSGTDALLASTGAVTLHRNFDPAARPDTWYAAALANQFAGRDVNGATLAEIGITFNADVDEPDVLGSVGWYYGLDAQPGADIDFITVALHEIGHGLGFLDTIDATTGRWQLGDNPSILERMLARSQIGALPDLLAPERLAAIVAPGDLGWIGPAMVAFNGSPRAVYSPDPFQPGSSIAHWNTDAPPELIAPFYTTANHDFGALLPALMDMGWQLADATPTPRGPAATPTPTRTAPPSPTPATPHATREMLYVTNFDDATVSVIDRATEAVVQTVAVDDGPLGIVAAPDGRRLYIAAFQAGAMAVVRTGDQRLVASIPVGESPNQIAITPDGALLAITDTAADEVVIVATGPLEVVARVPAGQQPSGIALDGTGRRAFVTNFSGASVTVIDLDAQRRRAIIPIPFEAASAGVLGIAIAPATSQGYVTAFYRLWARLLHTDTLFIENTVFPFPVPAPRLEAVVTNAAGTQAYFLGHDADTGMGKLAISSMPDNQQLGIVAVGRVPEALALAADETRVYVANTGDGTLSVVDPAARRVAGTIAVGRAPMGIVAVAVPDGQCPEECATPTAAPATPTATAVVTATVTPTACAGDCNADRRVTIGELVLAVNLALDSADPSGCLAADADGDGRVAITDLVRDVASALDGCGR